MINFNAPMLPERTIDGFISAGFVEITNDYDEILLSKSMSCSEMPGILATAVDGEYITGETVCTISLSSKGVLQILFDEDNFEERYNFLTNKKGFCEMAIDAGVKQEFLL